MTDGWKIYRLCDVCWGKGKIMVANPEITDPPLPPVEIECPQCHGDTIILWGYGYEKSFDELPPEPS